MEKATRVTLVLVNGTHMTITAVVHKLVTVGAETSAPVMLQFLQKGQMRSYGFSGIPDLARALESHSIARVTNQGQILGR
jgi:hypothetical protein